MNTAIATCSCGESKPHTISRRTTYEGVGVLLWDDGGISGLMGFKLPGVPMVRPRTSKSRAIALCAGWMLMGEVCITNLEDLGEVYARCRKAAARGMTLRQLPKRQAGPTPVWTVTSTDRDGRPTERQWRLPRLFWPGLAIIDHCTGTNGINNGRASGGRNGRRYELVGVNKNAPDVAITTGIYFRTIAEMTTYLSENKVQ